MGAQLSSCVVRERDVDSFYEEDSILYEGQGEAHWKEQALRMQRENQELRYALQECRSPRSLKQTESQFDSPRRIPKEEESQWPQLSSILRTPLPSPFSSRAASEYFSPWRMSPECTDQFISPRQECTDDEFICPREDYTKMQGDPQMPACLGPVPTMPFQTDSSHTEPSQFTAFTMSSESQEASETSWPALASKAVISDSSDSKDAALPTASIDTSVTQTSEVINQPGDSQAPAEPAAEPEVERSPGELELTPRGSVKPTHDLTPRGSTKEAPELTPRGAPELTPRASDKQVELTPRGVIKSTPKTPSKSPLTPRSAMKGANGPRESFSVAFKQDAPVEVRHFVRSPGDDEVVTKQDLQGVWSHRADDGSMAKLRIRGMKVNWDNGNVDELRIKGNRVVLQIRDVQYVATYENGRLTWDDQDVWIKEAPEELFVSMQDHFQQNNSGVYKLQADMHNMRRVWKKDVHPERWLFYSEYHGYWYISDVIEDGGYYRTESEAWLPLGLTWQPAVQITTQAAANKECATNVHDSQAINMKAASRGGA